MLQYLTGRHARRLAGIRSKVDKHGLEEAAALAAAVLGFAQELVHEFPIPEAVIQTRFIDAFRLGDQNLELELQAAIHEKSEDFQCKDISALGLLIRQHLAESAGPGR